MGGLLLRKDWIGITDTDIRPDGYGDAEILRLRERIQEFETAVAHDRQRIQVIMLNRGRPVSDN